MIDLITNNLDAIRKACEDHDVKALWVFGSAANGNWVEGKSDVDFLVELAETDQTWFKQFIGFISTLDRLLGVRPDVTDVSTLKSQEFIAELNRTKVKLYEAADAKVVARSA